MREKNDECGDDDGNKANWTELKTSTEARSVHCRERENKPEEDCVNSFKIFRLMNFTSYRPFEKTDTSKSDRYEWLPRRGL